MWFVDLAKAIRKSKLIEYGFCQNKFLWFHINAAGILLKGLLFFNIEKWLALSITIVVAIIWEIIEYYLENGGDNKKIKQNYGSIEIWKYDTTGDVLGVLIMLLIMIL